MDIQHLIGQAREEMEKTGHLLPIIFLEMGKSVKKKNGHRRHKKRYHLFALDVLSDTQNIAKQGGMLYQLSYEHCKKYQGWSPTSIAYYAEGWMARSNVPDFALDPSQDPDRVEMVIVQMWQATKDPPRQTYLLPVIRSITNNTITRLADPIGPRNSKSLQLDAFLQGALDAQKPDDKEVWEPRIKEMQQKIQSVSPEQRGAMIEFLVRNGIPREVVDEVINYGK